MENEKLYLGILNNLSEGVYFVNMDRAIIFWNKAAEDITGFSKEEMIGKHCQESNLRHIDAEGRLVCDMGCPLYATINDGQQRKHEVFVRHKHGHRIPIRVNIFPIWDNGSIQGAVEVFTLNSPTVYEDNLIEELSNSAMKDLLTGLPNRRFTESYMEYRLTELKRFERKFCVVFLDIDNFGKFNNTYGHELGDEVLKNVAKSIAHIIRKGDLYGRWGGEEFIGVFEIKADSDALTIGEKVRALIANSEVERNGEKLAVTASLGVAVARKGETVHGVVKRADLLMYQSKQNGKNCVTTDVKS